MLSRCIRPSRGVSRIARRISGDKSALRHELGSNTGISTTGEDTIRTTFLSPLLTPKQLSEAAHAEFSALCSNIDEPGYSQMLIRSGAGLGDSHVLGGIPLMNAAHLRRAAVRAAETATFWRQEPPDFRKYILSEFLRVCEVHESLLSELLILESGMHYSSASATINKGMERVQQRLDAAESGSTTTNLNLERKGANSTTRAVQCDNYVQVWDALALPSLTVGSCGVIIQPPTEGTLSALALKYIFEYSGAPMGIVSVAVCDDEMSLESAFGEDPHVEVVIPNDEDEQGLLM